MFNKINVSWIRVFDSMSQMAYILSVLRKVLTKMKKKTITGPRTSGMRPSAAAAASLAPGLAGGDLFKNNGIMTDM